MPNYIVTTPAYDERTATAVEGEYIYQPTRDVTIVVARNRAQARSVAVRNFHRDRSGYFGTVSDNPYVGLTVAAYDGPLEEE